MKLHKLYHLIALGSVLAFATAGCRNTPVGVTPIGNGRGGVIPVGGSDTPLTGTDPNFRPPPPVVQTQTQPHADPLPPGTGIGNNTAGVTDINKPTTDIPGTGIAAAKPDDWANAIPDPTILHPDTIYFDYDKSSVKASEESKLNEVVTYMTAHTTHGLRVEGNCDERGTEEYNRSLGDRRAMAAREYLVAHGVDASRILTVSYGKDKPVDTGRDEKAYSQNRRDDFVVLVPQSAK